MKSIFYLAILFITMSLFLFQSTSFSTAKITTNATLSIVSEDNAFIAISYGPGKQFALTNNIGETIVIESIELISDSDHKINPIGKNNYPYINPGGIQEFNITKNPQELIGKVIEVTVSWNSGSARIQSIIPDLKEDIMLNEDDESLELKEDEANADSESTKVEDGSELIEEEIVEEELDEGQTIPEVNEGNEEEIPSELNDVNDEI